jgi:lipoprotein-anchoring transpeptidase ErfK/SrfK
MKKAILYALLAALLLAPVGVGAYFLLRDDAESVETPKITAREFEKKEVIPPPPEKKPTPLSKTAYKTVSVFSPEKVYTEPTSGKVIYTIEPITKWSKITARYLVISSKKVDQKEYYEILLPIQPNNTTGWIEASRVTLKMFDGQVRVDLSERRVSFLKKGRVQRSFKAVVGKRATPTPKGRFAVQDIIPTNPGLFVGSRVIPLVAHSDVLETFGENNEPPLVALHGRGGGSLSDPLGQALSNGCIRLNNSDIEWLAARVQTGMPIIIR